MKPKRDIGLTEGKFKRGGVKPKPEYPRPNIVPKPQRTIQNAKTN